MPRSGGGAGWRVGEGVGSGSDAGQAHLEQPAHASRQGSGGDRHGSAGARQCAAWRRPLRGAQTAMTRRPRGSARSVMPRRPLRGARTIMTRRLRRCGVRLVRNRRPRLRGAGPMVVRHPMRGARSVMTRRARRRGGDAVMPRRHVVRGRATAGGRHDGARVPFRGAARCSRMVLHLPLPISGFILAGGGEMTTGLTPRPPLHRRTIERGSPLASSVGATLVVAHANSPRLGRPQGTPLRGWRAGMRSAPTG